MAHMKQFDPQTSDAEQKAARTSSSKGEKLFDWLTYGGIGFLGVFAAGIPVGYWGKYGGGKTMFNSSAKWLEKMGMSAKAADDAVMTSVLMQPGNLGLIPIKWMENNKPHLVDKFNDWLGDKSSDASVEKDPQQTWGSLIKSRLAAWLAVFVGFRAGATVLGGENFAKFENGFAEKVCNVLGKPTHTPGIAKAVETETKLFRYGKIAALDVFATAAATILLYTASRFFAKKNPEWHAQHAHLPNEEKESRTSVQQTSFIKGADALRETSSLFTDKVAPAQKNDLAAKPKPDSFTEALANKKSQAQDATPSLSA